MKTRRISKLAGIDAKIGKFGQAGKLNLLTAEQRK
jgi:hypothetical protein